MGVEKAEGISVAAPLMISGWVHLNFHMAPVVSWSQAGHQTGRHITSLYVAWKTPSRHCVLLWCIQHTRTQAGPSSVKNSMQTLSPAPDAEYRSSGYEEFIDRDSW